MSTGSASSLPLSLKVPALGLPYLSGAQCRPFVARGCTVRGASVKPRAGAADTEGMSNNTQETGPVPATPSPAPSSLGRSQADPRLHGVSPEFVERVRRAVEAMPETRPERIELARAVTLFNPPSAWQIAEAIVREMRRGPG